MSRNAPQTLSVKRKRNDVPPDSLVVEQRADTPSKRLKSDVSSLKNEQDLAGDETKKGKSDQPEGRIIWRRINIPRGPLPPSTASPPPQTPTRRFHISRASGNIVLFEDRPKEGSTQIPPGGLGAEAQAQPSNTPTATPQTVQQQTPVPRKRPGAGASLKPKDAQATQKLQSVSNGPSPEVLREFEKFSAQVENDEIPKRRTPIKPKAPKLRYKDRHPTNSSKHPDAMDLDSDYVIDTYVREIIMPDADGKVAQVEGTVGFIVLSEEDEAWWFDEDESDKEFDTDDEDENAEDYYANDYPEDELSSDDEFDRGGYNHYRGEGEEEYDLKEDDDDDARSDDDDIPLPQTKPKSRAVYWGRTGEQ